VSIILVLVIVGVRLSIFFESLVQVILDHRGICMRAIVVGVMLVAIFISPANATLASIQDRMRMSVSIADYIHDSLSNSFKTDDVELGPAAVERNFALADWRSADGKLHGQVSFFYLCDHWNVGQVSTGRPLRAQDLIAPPKSVRQIGSIPAKIASKLAAELAQLELRHVTYLKPAHFGITC